MVYMNVHDHLDDPAPSTTLQHLVDERDVGDVLQRYAWAVDSRDWDLLASCFTEDAALNYDTSGTHTSPAAFVANCRHNVSKIGSTQYFVGRPVVRVDGDEAKSRSYVFAQHTLPETEEPYFIGGVYHDRLL